jgi:acylpyruvate hydrolase
MKLASIATVSGPATVIRASDGSHRGLLNSHSKCNGGLNNCVRTNGESLPNLIEALLSGPVFPNDSFSFLTPIEPRKILCVGLNYRDHSTESNYQQPDYPTMFARYSTSLVPHDQPIVRPRVSKSLDYEGELVAAIGRGGRHISRENALKHVLGYSIFNEGSVRDYQFKAPQWTMGKNFDRTGAFGPYLVPADALPRGAAGLKLRTRLNGVDVQSACTDEMVFDVAALVSIISEVMTLTPGDIIVTGTPAGIGAARNPPLFMKPGDNCEVEIEGIGVLRNTIEDEIDTLQ